MTPDHSCPKGRTRNDALGCSPNSSVHINVDPWLKKPEYQAAARRA